MSELMQPKPSISIESVTEADLKEAMMGSSTDPTYAEQFGITSAPLGTTGYRPPSMAELELEAVKAMAKVQADAVTAHQAGQAPDPFTTPTDELAKWQKLYGESENEKGQLRKNQAELMEAFNGLMAQYEVLQTNATQQPWVQGQQPLAPQYGQPQGFAPQPAYSDPFAGLADDDVVQCKHFKDFMERNIAPAFGVLAAQTQQANARYQALENTIIKQAKDSSGVTPVDEFRLTAKNPWVRSLAPAQKIQAIASLRQAELATQPPPSVQAPAQIPAPTDAQQRILNKMTYVEGNVPNVLDSSEAALEAAKQRDYAKVMAAPQDTGERAKMFRAFAAKYGLGLGQNPSDVGH